MKSTDYSMEMCKNTFAPLRNKRIFISGGTGFLGKSLLDTLRECKDTAPEIYLLSRDPEGFLRANAEIASSLRVKFIAGDVRDFDFSHLPDLDFCIHAATTVDDSAVRECPDELFSVIADGTRHILEMCGEKKVTRMLYVSSGAVYGVQPPELTHMHEDCPCVPVNAYGQGKLAAEKLCSDAGAVIARCFSFVGPRLPLDKHYAIGNFIRNVLDHQDIIIKGDGSPVRSYMDASDLCEWLLHMMLTGARGQVYNVGSDSGISILALAERVAAQAEDRSVRIQIGGNRVAGIQGAHYVPDISRARSLGLELKVPLDKAIERTIRFHQEQR